MSLCKSNLLDIDEFESWLRRTGIQKHEIAIGGSAALSVRGLRNQGDLDLCITSDVRESLPSNLPKTWNYDSERFEVVGLSHDEIIQNDKYHDTVGGFKIVRPEIVFSRKIAMNRKKDRMDLVLLQQYAFQNPEDWDWELVRLEHIDNNYSQTKIEYLIELLEDFIFLTRSKGILFASKSTFDFITRRIPTPNINKDYLHPVRNVEVGSKVKNDSDIYYGLDELIASQFIDGEFRRYDLLIKLMYRIEKCSSEKTQISLDTYRGVIDIEDQLIVDWDDVLKYEPIEISLDNDILHEGGLVKSLHSQNDVSPVKINHIKKGHPDKGRVWMQNNGFSEKEIEGVETTLQRLMYEYGLYFYVIVWPPSIDYFDEIESKLANEVDIIQSSTLEVGDFNDFVRKIYTVQRMDIKWKIERKLNQLNNHGCEIGVMLIDLPNRDRHSKPAEKLRPIKNKIRKDYQKSNNLDYYHILHTSDDHQENRVINNLLKDEGGDTDWFS